MAYQFVSIQTGILIQGNHSENLAEVFASLKIKCLQAAMKLSSDWQIYDRI
jgi:hypothetical protein